jgi:cyclohexanone monooxygenase
MSTNLSVGIIGAGPGGLALGILAYFERKYMRRNNEKYLSVRPSAPAEFIAKIDRWMVGTVWTTQCSSYFRAANGRVVTQWPRSARSFWEMTRSFKPADYSFSSRGVKASAADGDAFTAANRRGQ